MPPAPSEAVKQALLKAVGTGHGKLPAAARDVRPIIVSIKICAPPPVITQPHRLMRSMRIPTPSLAVLAYVWTTGMCPGLWTVLVWLTNR